MNIGGGIRRKYWIRVLNSVLFACLIVGAVFGLQFTGVVDGLDRLLWEQRFKYSSKPVTGDLVVVDIDAKSLDELGVWPLPRSHYADLVRFLAEANVRDIVFDVDFSAASTPEEDRLFQEAIEEAGNVALAAFRQSAKVNESGEQDIVNQPIDNLLDVAWPVVVMVPVEPDSRIWRNVYGYELEDFNEVSASAYLGEFSGGTSGAFWLDYSIRIDRIPTYSLSDVLAGKINPARFYDKKVIVGASAQELRDLFPVPVFEMLPGAVIQALGAETLLQNRALTVERRWTGVAFALAVFMLLMTTRADGLSTKVLIFSLAAIALEIVAYITLQRYPVLVPSGAAHLVLFLSLCVIVLRELGFHKLISHLSQIRHRNSERILGQVFDDSFDAIIVVDRYGRINAASHAARELFDEKNLRDKMAREVLPADLIDDAIAALSNTSAIRPTSKTIILQNKNLQNRIIEYVVTRSERTAVTRKKNREIESEFVACLTCRDVTEEKEAAKRIEYLAKYDSLTAFFNRNGFEEELEQLLYRSRKDKNRLCLMQVAIGNLDQIVASLGYSYSDRLRKAIASRIRSHLAQKTVWSVLSPDVFACVVPIVPDTGQDKAHVDSILHVLAEDYMIDGARISVRLDIGYIIDDGSHTADSLLKKSGNALAKSRRSDRLSILAFKPEMDEQLQRRRMLETELFKAIVRDELRMAYQPIVDLKDGAVVSAEALLRWNHRQLGRISPAEFVPIAEENGYIVELGAWALNRGMKEALSWEKPVRLSINVSAVQFSRGDICSTVAEALERTGFPSERLDLEITESLFIDESIDFVSTMNRLLDVGCKFSLDDFGTGYSSLGYIPKFPFAKLKLDRIFVDGICDNAKDVALVRSVLQLAEAYDMQFVVEGIETDQQATVLRDIGCHLGQGYHYGRPMSATEFRALV